MSSLQNLAHILVDQTICFLIKLAIGSKIIETTAIINCGTTGNFIDLRLLAQANFPIKYLPQPVLAYNMDRTTNTMSAIWWKAHTKIILPHTQETIDLMVLNLECC